MARGRPAPRRLTATLVLAVAAAASLAGCGADSGAHQKPVAIRKGDTCAVCGMYIAKYAGPRGEAYVSGYSTPLKFGSTRDFFAYVTQPDEKRNLESVFVQDTARIDWAHPSNLPNSFTDARKAYYVAWQPLPGAMGPTFASFAKRSDAEAFIKAHGGRLLRYGDVTPEVVSSLSYHCPAAGSPVGAVAKGCVKKAAPAGAHDPRTQARMPGMAGTMEASKL